MRRRFRTRPAHVALVLFAATLAFGIHRLSPHVADTPVSLENLHGDLEVIAAAPRPVGGERLAVVRQYVLGRLRDLGFDPQVETGDGTDWLGKTWPLTSVLARLPADAPDGQPGLLVACHLDSVAAGPGAGDDGAGVASLLETARLLRDVTGRRRDVVFLVTDGEEAGLLGAKLWAAQHPDRMNCTDVLNFDARGTAGPAILFETCGDPGALLESYFAAAPQPVTSSVAAAVYERMPNGTDLTVFRAAGLNGLNFAFIDGLANYHTPRDDLAHLSDATLLHQASQMFAVTRQAVVEPGDATGRPPIYFDVASLFVVRYPRAWSWPLAGLSAALTVVAVVRLRPSWRTVAAGLLRHGLHLLAVVVAVYLVTRMPTGKLTHRWTWLAFTGAALLTTAGLPWVAGRRPRDGRAALAALLVLLCSSTVALAAFFEAGGYVLLVPSLLMSLAALPPAGRPRTLALAVAAAISTLVILPLAWLATLALTVRLLAGAAVLLVVLAWLWRPSLAPLLSRRRLAVSGLCLMLAAWAFAVVYLT